MREWQPHGSLCVQPSDKAAQAGAQVRWESGCYMFQDGIDSWIVQGDCIFFCIQLTSPLAELKTRPVAKES